jgi:hypothetical protein
MNTDQLMEDSEKFLGPGGLAPTPVDGSVYSIPQAVWNEKQRELDELRSMLKI